MNRCLYCIITYFWRCNAIGWKNSISITFSLDGIVQHLFRVWKVECFHLRELRFILGKKWWIWSSSSVTILYKNSFLSFRNVAEIETPPFLCSSISKWNTNQAQTLWNFSCSSIILCILSCEISSSLEILSIVMRQFAKMQSLTWAVISDFVAVDYLPLCSALSIYMRLFSNMLYYFGIDWHNIAFSP